MDSTQISNSFSPEVTTYRGFSNVSGTISLEQFFNQIASDAYKLLIRKIGGLIAEGNTEEAANVKRQLPFFTVTAGYAERRLPESITVYNDLVTIDIDGLSDDQVAGLRPLIEQDGATVGCFLTAKQHGYKIIAHLVNPITEGLRKEYLHAETIAYDHLEAYHARVYEETRRHYERLLGVPVDTSGKDISRGVFASYDPATFFAPERLAAIQPPTPRVIPAPPAPKQVGRKKNAAVHARPLGEKEMDGINPVVLLEFQKCVAAVRRIMQYEEGTHNPFLFTLGNKCFRRGLDEEEVKRLAAHYFGEEGKWNTDEPIANSYLYVSKTQKAKADQEDRRPVIEQVKAFLDSRYRFRRNTILERLEFATLSAAGHTEENHVAAPEYYQTLTAKDLNTIFLRMSEAGIVYPLNNLKSVIDSDYAQPYDPFARYFDSLPAWDGMTDYIAELADTIQTTDQTYWREVFRRWMVGMVACAIGTQHINQQAILLHGEQGKGKSTWIRRLLPPELHEYYRNGMINPAKKGDMMQLATRILINMEEFEGVRQADLPALKRIISQDFVIIRQLYEIQPRTYPRRASFIGSTNNTRFLNDLTGARRFLVVHTRDIDYTRPIDYKGLYAQVLYLVRTGYPHWFEGEEIETINKRNEQYRVKDPLEENLYVYFKRATPRDYDMKWQPAAAILAYLCATGRTLANVQSQQLLVEILERDGFLKRLNANGITEYALIILTAEEMEQNMKS